MADAAEHPAEVCNPSNAFHASEVVISAPTILSVLAISESGIIGVLIWLLFARTDSYSNMPPNNIPPNHVD